mmetsp:Transcript_67319/g.132795  ORF Transcript_67319/g.132795 Transcript_67319/m.132795 type:complete len:341 (-) Transcript_67319:283-1305(-)|eukprot:CAMPEP_0172738266 /NCGR_PEP_ID=MMETSP1074-20121228/119816_1 /TAXON_ID=2916 /ORGANISM="Ceratium fusus, Strain PA161109" /LENGTH=340 /DNA_ID=CAMNT_0013567871 /DNA_START=63 /DNA_END=1085 /DNA_ORIENTATION=-
MQRLLRLLVAAALGVTLAEEDTHHHHHNHHHHKHGHHHHKNHHNKKSVHEGIKATNASATVTAATLGKLAIKPVSVLPALKTDAAERQIVSKMKDVERELAVKEASKKDGVEKTMEVNGPLPVHFSEMFSQAVAQATNADPHKVKLLKTSSEHNGVVKLLFKASPQVADATLNQAADPDSRLVNGPLHDFLVLKGDEVKERSEEEVKAGEGEEQPDESGSKKETSSGTNPIDVDTAMPFGQLEPFGREDTAQELTEQSISESNEMVDQLERAEVAEEKRAVFRALTRLRGAAITSFDGIARTQTGNIDEYAKKNQWRAQHPVRHLAQEESDISKWAFPDF